MLHYLRALKRLDDVEDDLSRLKRETSSLAMQWTDTLDRLKSMMGRLAKERQRAEAAGNDRATLDDPERYSEDSPIQSSQFSLTPAQQAAQAKILARRARKII